MPEIFVPEGEARALIRYRLTGDAEEMVITLGLRDEVAPPLTFPNTVAQSLLDAWMATMHPAAANLTSGWTLVGTTVYLEEAGGANVGEAIVNLVGTGAGTTLPPNCTYLVKKGTGSGGRRNRGRFYLPQVVLTEGDVSSAGFIDSADVAALQAQLDNFIPNLSSEGLVPVLFHYPYTGVAEPPSTEITSFTLDAKIATQRRRLR